MQTAPAGTVKPRFDADVYVVPMGQDELQVRAGEKMLKLSGRGAARLFESLLPRMTGERSLEEIVAEVDGADRSRVLGFVGALLKHRVLRDARDDEGAGGLPPEEIAAYAAQLRFFGHFQKDRHQPQLALRAATAAVVGGGRLAALVASNLRDCGLGRILAVGGGPLPEESGRVATRSAAELAEVASDAAVVVVCCEEPAVEALETVNEACLLAGTPWLRCTLDGYTALLGPTVIPGETACYHCYRLRERSNAKNAAEHAAFERWLHENPDHSVRYGSLAPFAPIAAGYAALEAVRLLTGIAALDPTTVGHLLVIDLMTYDTEAHRVLRVPRCAVCGPARARAPRQVWGE